MKFKYENIVILYFTKSQAKSTFRPIYFAREFKLMLNYSIFLNCIRNNYTHSFSMIVHW